MRNFLHSLRKWGGKMRKGFLIARSNIRKAKGQTAAIVVLILLAALMFHLWLMLSIDYKQNFDWYHRKLNAEHVTVLAASTEDSFRLQMADTLKADPRTEAFCMDDILGLPFVFDYSGGAVSCDGYVMKKETALQREVGRVEIVEDSAGSGIYLPLLYGMGDNYRVGDILTLNLGENTVRYPIRGFFNSIMTGSHNCTINALLLTEDLYDQLAEESFVCPATLLSVRIYDQSDSESYEAMIKNVISAEYPEVRAFSNSYTLVSQSRYISQTICSGIISAMAFFILLIALVVLSSNIVNYIQKDMKNLGALKAVGYTGNQLICVLLLQFLGVIMFTVIVGIGLSYCLFPAVNEMMISQTGIPYTMRFLPLPSLMTAVVICGVVALAVWLSSRRIKKIEPIVALRQGIQTHNFRNNRVSLDRTHVSLDFALALKTTFSGVKQNITVCITMLVLSLIVVFSGLMWRNMIVDVKPFADLIAGEYADSCMNVNREIEEEFLKALQADSRVEKVYLYSTIELRHVGGIALSANLSDDFSDVNNPGVVYEGRYPKFDNEVAIAAKYAREQGIHIGNEITLTADGHEVNYIVTGFTQVSNYLGKDCLLTRGGYERIGTLQNASYYINLTEETDVDAFNLEFAERFGEHINTTINILSVMDGTSSVYISTMTVIVIAIFVLSIIIIVFVLYLLVRTMLNNKKRDYGIMKALGFTTGRLILQTALSLMPAVILSMAAGLAVSAVVINPLVALFLNGLGIVKCTFTVPVGFIVIAGSGLILFAFGIACLLSLKIRKITPRELLAGE